jgi:hypothetical protein
VLLGGGAHHVDVAVDVAPVLQAPSAPGPSAEAGRSLR